jgi:metallo-beta-lactamase family protein
LKITLLGAAGSEVTGSCYLLETTSAKVLVDCGMFQGSATSENRNRIPTAAQVARIDAVVLTHAHLDHTGRLPLLAKLGYRAPIYCTRPTVDLANLVLQDSALLQLSDCERENRKRAAQGRAPIEPLYRPSDVDALRPLFRTFEYDEPTEVAKGISVRAVDAGHMLGSASLELTVSEEGRKRVVVFSGDIGPRGAPIHRDPTAFARADILFLESTYGDRDHRRLEETAIEGATPSARLSRRRRRSSSPHSRSGGRRSCSTCWPARSSGSSCRRSRSSSTARWRSKPRTST